MYVCMYARTYVLCVCVRMYAYMCVRTYVCVYVYTFECIYLFIPHLTSLPVVKFLQRRVPGRLDDN